MSNVTCATTWMNKQTETETLYSIGTVKILYILYTFYILYFMFMSYSTSYYGFCKLLDPWNIHMCVCVCVHI
jgi:hypothetical protein